MEKRQKRKSGESETQGLECKSSLKVYTWVLATSFKRTEREDKGDKYELKTCLCQNFIYRSGNRYCG